MVTKRLISDAVLMRLAGGYADGAFPVQHEDVQKAAEQKINAKFRMRQFDNMKLGETVPDGLCMANYTGIDVVSDGDRSKAILPVMPISLPRNMGIFDVGNGDNRFIPLLPGQRQLLRVDSLLNDLLNQIGYEPRGITLHFTKDIRLLGYNEVDADLIVSDFSTLSDTDPVPIPASYEDELINELVLQFSPVQPETGKNDVITTIGQQPTK